MRAERRHGVLRRGGGGGGGGGGRGAGEAERRLVTVFDTTAAPPPDHTGWVPAPPASSDPGPEREPVSGESWQEVADWEPLADPAAEGGGQDRVLRVPRRAAVAALGLAVVVSVAAGVRAVTAAATTTEVPARAAASPGPTPPSPPAAATDGGPGPTGVGGRPPVVAERVVVHVVGQVARPGVVRLPAGSRVEEAVAAAGGAERDADLARVNLARVLVDGEQVVVPRPGEAVVQAPAPGDPSAQAAPVDLNTATEAELDTLPGVGPVLAGRIVQWRSTNGRFTRVDELAEVAGIGPTVLERLRPLVRV